MKTENEVKTEVLKSEWSVKGVKFMPGHDAPAMSCSLYRDGKRVATVFDDSWGGGYQYRWLVGDLKDFDAFSTAFVVESKQFKDGLPYDADCVVDILVNAFEDAKRYKKLYKTKTVFSLKDTPDEVWTINLRFCPKVKEHLVAKYGENLNEIFNEKF